MQKQHQYHHGKYKVITYRQERRNDIGHSMSQICLENMEHDLKREGINLDVQEKWFIVYIPRSRMAYRILW